MIRSMRLFAACAALLALLPLTACHQAGTASAADGRGNGAANGAAAGHWVFDARLREIMADLDRQARTTWPQEIETTQVSVSEPALTAALDEACKAAAALADGARRIPDAVARTKMSRADRDAFLALVETLRSQAVELDRRAAERDLPGMRTVLADIDDTCASCHVRFRDYAGAWERE